MNRCLAELAFLFAALVVAAASRGAVGQEDVFFEVSAELVDETPPAPSSQLITLQGYPYVAGRLTILGRLYTPDPAEHGVGPYPAVIILHGSGGLWSNDLIDNGLSSQFREWGGLLAGMGYLTLFPDSYNPRGIPGNFSGRKPHHDPAEDDHLCSPNYERPKDVLAALTYLVGRPDFDGENVALIGFSHGAQTAMNAMVDPSVDLDAYTVSFVDLVVVPDSEPPELAEDTVLKPVPSPVRIPQNLPVPKVCAFFYGGGSHYRYHGSASSTAAGRFMFHRDTHVLMFHGTEDSLLGVDDPSANPPLSGNLYPIKQAMASSAQATAIGVDDPLQHHFLMAGVEHSFDGVSDAAEMDWNTQNETPDQKAKRLCRPEVLKWLEAMLKPRSALTIEEGPMADEITVRADTSALLRYQWRQSSDLVTWTDHLAEFDGTGMDAASTVAKQQPEKLFFQLGRRPIPPPFEDPNHAGFFLDYSDFDLGP